MSDPRHIAASIVGAVEWQTDVSGFCKCPGEALHTHPTGNKDCRVNVDGAPTIYCFHASCAPVVAEANQRLRRELVGAGLRDVRVETITETTTFASGDALWEWIVWSNPIVECILGSLELTEAERAQVRRSLDALVRERAAGGATAALTNPVNIGVGRK